MDIGNRSPHSQLENEANSLVDELAKGNAMDKILRK